MSAGRVSVKTCAPRTHTKPESAARVCDPGTPTEMGGGDRTVPGSLRPREPAWHRQERTRDSVKQGREKNCVHSWPWPPPTSHNMYRELTDR